MEGNMIPLEKFGNYEYAENYCRNRNSKIGHNLILISEAVIAAIIQSGFYFFDHAKRLWTLRQYFS